MNITQTQTREDDPSSLGEPHPFAMAVDETADGEEERASEREALLGEAAVAVTKDGEKTMLADGTRRRGAPHGRAAGRVQSRRVKTPKSLPR